MASTNASSHQLEQYISDKQTVCFGRFLLDIPKDVEVVFGRQEVDGKLEYLPNEEEHLDELMNKHLAQLEKDRYLIGSHQEDIPRYGEIVQGGAAGQRIVFGSTDFTFHSLTSYIPKTPHLFIHTIEPSANDSKHIELMNNVARQLRLRPPEEIPSEPGICVDGGFIPFNTIHENIAIGVRLRRYPDVHFSIETIKHLKFLPRSTMIEERIKSSEENASPVALLWHKRIKYLRRGEKILGAWKGEEVAARLPPQDGQGESHQFRFISLGEINNPFHPEIDIELVSGVKGNSRGAVKPSLSDEEMLLLWDTLISSIRVRPTGPVEKKPAPKAALGTAHATGHICPQTGWWECDEPGVVPDARKKFVREGETMPKTTVRLERNAWEKLTRSPELSHSGAVWKLVAYEDPDVAPGAG